MNWGFLATNENGQVLVSSETRNLHFVGKARLDRVINQFDGYGGLRHWAFRVSCKVTPVPFFTMPSDDYYAVAAVRQVDVSVWEIEVIRSGTGSSVPEVYVFSDPRGATNSPDTQYGMMVLNNDGTPSFDSRYKPLAITGGASVAPPDNPLTNPVTYVTARFCDGWDTTPAPAPPADPSAPPPDDGQPSIETA